jgi:hypothetical protein
MENGTMFYKKIDMELSDYFIDNNVTNIGIINCSVNNIDKISPILKTFYNIQN